MKAITYQRVSTGKQAESGLSLEDQADRLAAELGRRGWDHAATYTDAGRSGRSMARRPELRAALEVLAAGEADVLMVTAWDRLARSMITFAQIANRSEAEGWALVALDLDLDTSTPAGKLTATVLGAVAEYESELIADRARMTHRRRRMAGKRAGQAPQLPDTVRLEVAARVDQGETLAAIADDLDARQVPTARGGRWWPSTVAHVARSVDLDADLEGVAA